MDDESADESKASIGYGDVDISDPAPMTTTNWLTQSELEAFQCMFKATARVLSGPQPLNRPNNYRHPFIFVLSRAERRTRVLGEKEKYNHPLTLSMRDERLSRTMTFLLRHKAVEEGLPMRKDGYVKISDLLAIPKLQSADFLSVERIVKNDKKGRFSLLLEPDNTGADGIWWIRANQGHSIQDIKIDMIRIIDESQVPMAVHGTTSAAWGQIANEGLCRMNRQHIHFAQGIPRSGVLSGMRTTSQVYIFLDVAMALEYGLELLLSSNGVVLSPGDENGYIHPCFFSKVEWAPTKSLMKGWSRPPPPPSLRKPAITMPQSVEEQNERISVVDDDAEEGI